MKKRIYKEKDINIDNMKTNDNSLENNLTEDSLNEDTKDDNVVDKKNETQNSENNDTKCVDEKTELLNRIAEINDKYLRVYSDFDNYRKRTIKEKNELGKFANSELITELLPVVDDLERALKIMQRNPETESLIQGIELIYNKLLKILESQGLKAINAIGEIFNTDFHEAVTKIPAENEEQKGKVFDEIQKGYELYDKVIRYAKVVVAE